ncbi:MAG TPA: hypothetical protein VKX17_27910 [Planctomycetota bacterium]|nr:hypothetical protein [Planctomycetota bacterium]
MKAITTIAALAVLALVSIGLVRAEERNIADGLAATGAALAAKGNIPQAKDMLYKALVHDENCPDALYELARIIEKEDVSLAADLYQRAFTEYTADNKPASAAKRSDAEKRMRTLNPAAPKLTAAYEDYAQDLDKVVKKLTDNLTETSAMERVNDLKLATLVTSDKMPKFYTAAQEKKSAPTPPAADNGNKGNNPGTGNTPPRNRFGRTEENPKNGTTTPEVEKELKALGWATVSGSWVKKGPNIYEATDAKLEAPKTSGTIDLWIVKDPNIAKDTVVKAAVRNDAANAQFGGFGNPGGGPTTNEMNGYGIRYEGKDFREFGHGDRNRRGPGGGRGQQANNGPMEVGRHNTTEGRNHFVVKIDDSTLEIYFNDSRTYNTSAAKIAKNGNFMIDVNGTVTIEMPKVTGQ